MSRTIWRPAPYYSRGTWLMYDGSVRRAPMVETTPSQRRWRIAGTQTSVQKQDLPREIVVNMQAEAKRNGTEAWLEITDDEDAELRLHTRAMERVHTSSGTEIDFTSSPKISFEANETIPIAFEFKHSLYPLRVIIWVVLRTDRSGNTNVSSGLTYRPGDPMTPQQHQIACYLGDEWATGSPIKPSSIGWTLGTERFGNNPRKAAAHFLELLQQAQEVDTVTIPDGRDPSGNAVLEFEFTRTNYTQDFYRQVLDVVQSGPAMKRLAEHLDGIRHELSNLGLVVSQGQFDLRSLLNGKLSELQVTVNPQDSDSDGKDKFHTVHIDLARGVLVVSCTRHKLEEVAEQWNIAKFKAEVTGETDALLAYAQAYNDPGERARLRKIIRERTFTPPA